MGDKVMLKVSAWKGFIRFGKRGKLNPRYIGPFNVLSKVGTVAYRIELPQQLSKVHSTFHVSNLKRCLFNESLMIPLDEIHIDDKLHFVEEPMEIMDREFKRLKQSRIPIIKGRWNSWRSTEFTFGVNHKMTNVVPALPMDPPNTRDRSRVWEIRESYESFPWDIFEFQSLNRSMDSDKYLEAQSMLRPPLFESDHFIYWKNRFETYVKAKDLDLWPIILNGDFPPVARNKETQILEMVPFEQQDDDLKKKLAKNNEA
ncbi:hypothetical protein Tco_1523517 [Tanacetum coccineum]